jgi:hypothetical protein
MVSLAGHPERQPRNPEAVTLKLSHRDPSASLGMTVFASNNQDGALVLLQRAQHH